MTCVKLSGRIRKASTSPKIATAAMAMIQQIVTRSVAVGSSGLGCCDFMDRNILIAD